MTAPAQLGEGPAAPTRSLPAPPMPVPPLTPPMRQRHRDRVSPERERMLTPALPGSRDGCLPSLRSNRVTKVGASAIVTLAVVGALGWMGQAGSRPGVSPGIPARTTVIRVGAGETIWDVALRVAPQADQRAVVERIRERNGIVGSAITPGQQLQVPTSGS